MYLAFSSCGYTAQKTLYLTAPAWPLSTQPVGLGILGPEIMCGVYSGRCGPRSLSCVIVPGLCLPTAQHAGLILNVISVLSMACCLSTEWFRTVQLCQIRPKVHLTPAFCLWQRQVEVGSGQYNTSSQKYFHILQQFMLSNLARCDTFSFKGFVLSYPHYPAAGSSTTPVLCFSKLPLDGSFRCPLVPLVETTHSLCNHSALCVIL